MAKNENKLWEQRMQSLFDYDPRKGLNEYVAFRDSVDEGGDNDEDPNAQGADPAAAGGDPNAMGGAPAPGGDPAAMGGDPNAMGGAPAPGGDPAAMGGDPNAMGGAPAPGGDQGDATPPEGFNPQDPSMDPMAMGGDPAAMDGGEAPSGDDDVIDISDFTNSQEEMEQDIDKIDGKFAKVLKAIGAFEELLRSNDEKIEDLKAEFERRNPTQVEKLGMQQANSYPFNVNPNDYWKEKEATSNYSTEPDNNGKEQGQYVITADDVNGDVNWKGIYDSLNDDFLYNQTLDKLVRI